MNKTLKEWYDWFWHHYKETKKCENESDAEVWVAYESGQHHEYGNCYVYFMCEKDKRTGLRSIVDESRIVGGEVLPVGIYCDAQTNEPITLVYFKDGSMVEMPDGFNDMDIESQRFTWEML